MPDGWYPKIVAFCCNWCSYGGADTAGVSRMQYPPSVRIIRVMCSGRVEPAFVLKAFREGADGVFVGGCHLGDCHYQAGNYKWWRRAELIKRLLDEIGIGSERFEYDWISASEGEKFAEVMRKFHERIEKLGPLKLNEKLDLL